MADWAKALVDAGGPIIKGLIERGVGGGIKGKIAGGIADTLLKTLAEQLGSSPTPESIGEAIERDPERGAVVVQRVEAEVSSTLEIGAGDLSRYIELLTSDSKNEGILSRLWRPLFAIAFTATYVVIGLTLCYLMLNRELGLLANLTQVAGFLTFYIVAGCAVLGVQVFQRSEEKKQGV